MSARDDLDDLLLARHYGLLDPDQLADLERQLAALPDAAEAAARVERLQGLLAEAARNKFPDVAFEAPSVAPAKPAARPAAVGFSKWLVAVAALLAIATLGWPVARYAVGRYDAHQRLAVARAAQSALENERTQVVQAFERDHQQARKRFEETGQLVAQYRNHVATELDRVEREVRARQIYFVVTGPESLQPGAPNVFQVETRSVDNDAVTPADLDVKVVDKASGKTLFEQQNLRSNGVEALRLPLDLPAKPGSELALVLSATKDNGPATELKETLALSRPVYTALLSTDKPMYQPGETVRFRSLTLDRFSYTPPTDDMKLAFELVTPRGEILALSQGSTDLRDANGQTINGPDGKPLKGVGTGDYTIPEEFPGGEYTLRVRELGDHFPAQERKFIVNKYVPDTLEKELEFHRKSYGPGDDVVANCKVSENNRPLANRPVSAVLRVDGKDIPAEASPTDAAGAVAVRAKLPAKIDSGIATITVSFDNGGVVEAIVKPVPLVLTRLDVEFFPEGGDLITGVPNRVYFQVRTPTGKAAEIQGVIVDDQGQELTPVATLNDPAEPGINQGQGRFSFTPQAGRSYSLKVTQPATVTSRPALPKTKDRGVVLSVPVGVTNDAEMLNVRLQSPDGPRELLVGAYCRGRLLDHKTLTLPANEPTAVLLKPAAGFGGVTRVTVFEKTAGNYKPVAERLVYRRPTQKLDLVVKPAASPSLPGEKVRLTVSATDEMGKPAPAVLMLAVVNQSVITMADEKTARSLPTHFLLTSEVRQPEDLEHADVLLGQHPKAAEALDLLLGTQGWRRFAEQNPAEFRQQNAAAADRILVRSGGAMARPLANTIDSEQEKVLAAVKPDYDRLAAEWQSAHAALTNPADQQQLQQKRAALDARLAGVTATVARATEELRTFERQNERLRAWIIPVICAVLMAIGVVGLMRAAVRQARAAIPYYAASAATIGLCGLLLMVGLLGQDATGTFMQVERQVALAPGARLNEWPGDMAPQMEADVDMFKGGEDDQARPMGAAGANGFRGQRPAAKRAPLPPAAPKPIIARPELLQAEIKEKAEAGDAAKMDKAGQDGLNRNAAEFRKALDEQFKKADRNLLDAKGEAKKPGRWAGLAALEQAVPNPQPREPEAARKAAPPAAPPALRDIRENQRRLRQQAARGFVADKERSALPALKQMKDQVFDRLAPPGEPVPVGDPIPQVPSIVVREYRHARSPRVPGEPRTDFTETVCWLPALVLNEQGGGSVEFDLADSVGRYRVLAAGHTLNGRLGSATSYLEARKPFSVDPKLPIEVTRSDRIDVPVAITNDTADRRSVLVRVGPVNLEMEPGSAATRTADQPEQTLTLAPQERTRQVFRFRPTIASGEAALAVIGQSEPFEGDEIVRTIQVVPEGFPQSVAVSDQLDGKAETMVRLPAWVKGSLTLKAEAYPSTLADLQQGLDGLLREPYGCFEQTSTSNYPNLLILDYLESTKQAKPETVRRAKDLLDRGYQRLTSFECVDPADGKKREGYEWFGGTAPPHEALTAYGLLQFRDMSRVQKVDPAMLERTRSYLMSRLDRTAWTFKRNSRALDSFGGAPPDVTDAYILWALTEVKGEKPDDLGQLPDVLLKKSIDSKDPYLQALVGTAMVNLGRTADGIKLLEVVATAQAKDGSISGATTSITRSGGQSLLIETTALAVLGWLKTDRLDTFGIPIKNAIRWIGSQRGGYGAFGSTQSTILALKALSAYARNAPKDLKPGQFRLFVGDKMVAEAAVGSTSSDAITLAISGPEADALLKEGDNTVRVELTGGNSLPYTLAWSYNTLKPTSAEQCAVRLTTSLAKAEIVEGESVRMTAVVENVSGQGQGMTIAVIGLPAGLKLPEDMKQLKEMARLQDNGSKPGLIGFWEVKGRELILYWRELAPGQKIEVPLDLIGNVPGEYRGPASRAYLYYNPDHKSWTDPLQATVSIKPPE